MPLPTNPVARKRVATLTRALLKLPPERARKVIADERQRREKIQQAEAKK